MREEAEELISAMLNLRDWQDEVDLTSVPQERVKIRVPEADKG